ncbi:MAG: hypothetical protein ABSF63_13855 [Candidatus Bathyarchaeia archaeon]
MDAYGSMFEKQLLFLLLFLASIVGSLFAIFTFLATSSFGGTLGLVLFLLVSALLIAGYMLGFMVFAFLAIWFLTNYWSRRSK